MQCNSKLKSKKERSTDRSFSCEASLQAKQSPKLELEEQTDTDEITITFIRVVTLNGFI